MLHHRIDVKRKAHHSGFTLIELLVSIVIIGILSGIALPSFLSQRGRAKASEARSSIGLINRAQQAYRYENAQMASSLAVLGVALTSDNYTYSIVGIDVDNAAVTTTSKIDDLRVYSSRVQQTADLTSSIVCESNQIASKGTTSQIPIDMSTCDLGYDILK